MNTKPSIYRMRPVLITVLLALVADMAWVTPAAAVQRWKITGLSVKPDPTLINEFKTLSYMDYDKLTVKCSYKQDMVEQPTDKGEAIPMITISDNGVKKDSITVTAWQGDTRTIHYNVSGLGLHHIKCVAAVFLKNKIISIDEKTVIVNVMAKKPEAGQKWPTAPIIVTPGENQKVSGGNIVVKPYNPVLSHCADGGVFSLDWQYLDKSTSTWKRIPPKLSSLWKCVPEGSIKDISYLKPGLYKVSAQEHNGKHKFESDWSAWVTFELVK